MLRVGSEYNTELQRLVVRIKKDVQALLLPVIEQEAVNYLADSEEGSRFYFRDGWADRVQAVLDRLNLMYSMPWFSILANQVASKFVRASVDFVDKQHKRNFGIDVYNDSPKMQDYLRAATIQNVKLIESIPKHYMENVMNTVYQGMRNGVMPRNIAMELNQKFGVESRHAKFIARDQAAKINGEISKRRQEAAGFEYFLWLDADDSRVRHRHRVIANADVGYGNGVYRWDDLPKSSAGETIQPGSDYQCRCIARPQRTSVIEKYIASKKN